MRNELKASADAYTNVAYVHIKQGKYQTSSHLPFLNGDLALDFDIETNELMAIEWIGGRKKK